MKKPRGVHSTSEALYPFLGNVGSMKYSHLLHLMIAPVAKATGVFHLNKPSQGLERNENVKTPRH
ncbi:MAG TPA: hypothetical protein DCX14_07680 [Flavobacteriales bacterium]|nr:hypothetical protein [Flavobacteriales bacterium]